MFESSVAVVSGGAFARAAAPGTDVLDELTDVAERLRAVVERARGASGWGGATSARVVRALDQVASLVTAARGPVLLAQHTAAARAGGERAFVDTRARLSGTTRFAAAREVAAAHAMDRMPLVGAAVAEHAVPSGHLDVLGQALAGASDQVARVLSDERTQEQLVELAQQTDARQFSRQVAALVAEHDPDRAEGAREDARRARHLTLSHGPRGTSLKGFLDPLAGQVLARALDATGHREDEDRTRDQARADALTALAQHTLTGGLRAPRPAHAGVEVGDGTRRSGSEGIVDGTRRTGGDAVVDGRHGHDGEAAPDGAVSAPAAHVSLLVPAETWVAVREAQARRRGGRAEDAGHHVPPVVTDDGTEGAGHRVPPAVSDDGTVLTRTELAAALCDCAMTRVVMDAQGLPLDVGRARRMFTPAQRLAVVARDRQCAWNGCSVAARYCHVHHIRWWHRDRGRSDLDNAVLLCSHHHHLVHALDLDVERVVPPPRAKDGAMPAGTSPGRPGERGRATQDDVGPPHGGGGGGTGEDGLSGATALGARYVFRGRTGRVHNGPSREPLG
ncbi:HNH endonuclease signature motif containing protein [Cellulomonas palmilytica]|uniref:HNH endonuclease signature motif containing protein n=1 Tax=Cellulomonas palmilytica TaxID=2608402 RepID=UPI001F363484|nr:HNH endonuclease signature motif containing protein [Cellulomonas palmilytica]